MAQGRHEPQRSTRAIAVVGLVAGVLVLALGGAAYSAYRYEQAREDTILPGVKIAGVDVGGMTRAQALRAVRQAAAGELRAPIRVTVAGERWIVTPQELGERANVVAAVNRALAVNESMGTFSRFWHRFRDEPVGKSFRLKFRGHGRVDGFVDDVAAEVAVKPVNASITYAENDVGFVEPKPGRALDREAAAAALREALRGDAGGRVTLKRRAVKPKVTPENLGYTIVVRLAENRLYLYDGFEVTRNWSVATAKPGWTTPSGDWKVYRMAENPTWYNPALDSWGAALPAVIPGGPGNPMGTRALYITAPGLIRIHGTTDDSSIGRYASHGCIRMHNVEVEELYRMVPVGTHVLVVGSRPAGAQEWDTPQSADI